jgi:hypothetical protein
MKVFRINLTSWFWRTKESEVFFNIENILFDLSVYIYYLWQFMFKLFNDFYCFNFIYFNFIYHLFISISCSQITFFSQKLNLKITHVVKINKANLMLNSKSAKTNKLKFNKMKIKWLGYFVIIVVQHKRSKSKVIFQNKN